MNDKQKTHCFDVGNIVIVTCLCGCMDATDSRSVALIIEKRNDVFEFSNYLLLFQNGKIDRFLDEDCELLVK